MVLFKLLGLPFSLPAAGVKFVFNQLIETAEIELTDDTPVKQALVELNMQLEEGEISEEEFAEHEALLFQRLREIRAYREARVQEMLAARAEALEYERGSAVIEADLGGDER